ncbi:LamG-like jellyroll fold domain-containing protein [Cellulosimicrobium cellulans]|uniref:LamG-like jellyroll fold domain-containing protein n=1 Tax=Cellulosimicrobium cellulans TaxID=1710 RepID=UPI002096A8B0|nr:LamG-like jellyroll fold domain-containing protein [Cellulosimicrobium cellulans]MCO7274152.1 Ig-like domain-containing protein [Cellulosimicrobium cellulans]
MSVPARRRRRPVRAVAALLAVTLGVGVLVTASEHGGWGAAPAAAAADDVVGDVAAEARVVGGTVGQDVAPNFPASHRGPESPSTVARSLWWSWTAPRSGPVTFSTAGSELDTVLRVREGSGRGPVVATNDDDGDVSTSAAMVDARAGERYLVEVEVPAGDGLVGLSWQPAAATADEPAGPAPAPDAATALTAPGIPLTGNTGEKPQSKVWFAHGSWWAVLASASTTPAGTWVWRYDGAAWTNVASVSTRTDVRADVKQVGDVVHVLLHGSSSSLVSLQYAAGTNSYVPWTSRPTATALSLPGSETATLDVDGAGRMWVAYDTASAVQVRYADAPYASFSSAITLASGITEDDIALVTAMPGGTVGVLWSNQATERFGFRTHVDGASPSTWSADEKPAQSSALPIGDGFADDHLNVAVTSDGTLYAAIKTSYDSPSATTLGLLVRRPDGTWDPVYEVDRRGTRPIVLVDEQTGSLRVVYTASEQLDDILEKVTPLDDIDFSGAPDLVLDGSYNNVTSSKANVPGEALVLAASSATTGTARLAWTALGAPTATDGAASTVAGGVATGVLRGSSPTDAPLHFEIVQAPAHGTAAVTDASTGAFTYAPAAGYVGPDAFTFRVRAGELWSNVARVSLAVTSEAGARGRWDLDEGTGLVTADTSGWGQTGAVSGGTTWVTGRSGTALRFDGSTGRVTVPDAASLDLAGTMTVAAWVRPERVATQHVVKKARSYEVDGYELSVASTGRPFFRVNQASSGDAFRVNATSVPVADGSTWTHLVGTFDGARLRLFVNGVEQGSVAGPAAVGTNALPLAIGDQSGGGYPFQGAVDGVRLYDRALSAAEVAALYAGSPPGPVAPVATPGSLTTVTGTAAQGVLAAQASGAPTFEVVQAPAHGTAAVTGASTGAFTYAPAAGYVGPDAFTFRVRAGGVWSAPATVDVRVLAERGTRGIWDLDEQSGTTVADRSGWSQTGTLSGGTSRVAGVAGSAVRFDGTSGRITVPDRASLDLAGTMTVAAWVRPERVATQHVVKKARSYEVDGYELSVASTGRPFFRVNQASSGDAFRVNATSVPVADGSTWTHLVGTFDGARLRLFVNGVEQGSVAGPAAVGTNALPLAIGDQSGGGYPFQGAVDGVRLYDRALSAAEVAALYAGGTSDATAPGTDPTDPGTGPTDPGADPTDPGTGPTDPGSDPTDPGTGPTDPGTDPVDPAVPPVVEDLALSTVAGTAVDGTVAVSGATGTTLEVVTPPGSGTAEVLDPSAGTVRFTPAPGFTGTTSFTVRAGAQGAWSAPATVEVRVLLAAGARGAWRFDETGQTASDGSGWGTDGALASSGVGRVAGVSGSAVRFDGTAGRVSVPDAAALDVSGPMTVAAWVRPERVATQYVVKKAVLATHDGYEIGLSSAGKAFFRVNQATSGDTFRANATSAYPVDGTTWTHLVGVFDGGRVRLYVDGVEQGSVPGPAAVGTNDRPLLVGDQPGGGYPLKGAVDDVLLLDRALSPAEVAALAGGGFPGS